MKCKNCGYEYNGMFCPECGTRNEDNASAQVVKAGNTTKEQEPLETQKDKVEKKQGVSETQSAENEGKTMAVLSLVFGIIGLCTCGTLWIPQILGIVFGLLGKKQGKMRGMAKGGLICGAVSMVMAIVAIVIALIIAENPSDMASDPESIKIEGNVNTGVELDSLQKGKYYTFDAIFWTTRNDKKYTYAFSCWMNGEEHAKSFFISDATGGELAFLKDYSYDDKVAIRMTAAFEGIEDTEKQQHYLFKCVSFEQIESSDNTGNNLSSNSSDELAFTVDANMVEGGERENALGDGMDNPSDGQGTDASSAYGYEGNYVIAAQSDISGTVEQIYAQAFGDGYYIQLSGTNEFGEQMAISGIATESAAISDAGSNVYYMWDESCDNLQFMVTFYDSDYMDIQYIDSAVMDDREEHLGQTFSSTYFRQ